MKPWNAGNTAGRIVRLMRFNGVPYSGIIIPMLWGEAVAQGFTSPTWMTYSQASELNAHVRKGEKGSLVVYANSITRTQEYEHDEESEREIQYVRGYTLFNVEQIEGLPDLLSFLVRLINRQPCLVFVETVGNVRKKFVGILSCIGALGLANKFTWFELAATQAYSQSFGYPAPLHGAWSAI